MNTSLGDKMEIDSENTKFEEEIDELEDDYFQEEEANEAKDNALLIHDFALPEPTVRTLTTQVLHDMIHQGEIDIDPLYQREVVWPETKQVALIDSVFRHFYIPPVILAVSTSDGVTVRTCVDGKQRLTSIQAFIDGQIPHKDFRTGKKYYFTVPQNSAKPEVPPALRVSFQEKRITVVEYHDISPAMEREIFQRVQLGMPLTVAEKLQAVASPWGQWISEIEQRHIIVEGGLKEVLSWDTKRGRDFQNVAHMIYCCDGYPDSEQLPTAQKIDKWINSEDIPHQQFKDDIDRVLRRLLVIATTPEYNSGFTKVTQRIAPVEFIFIGVLLYVLRREKEQIQGKAILYLRRAIRQQFKDIRNNSDVGRAMWQIIHTLSNDPNADILNFGQTIASKGKRKRPTVRDEEDEDEFRPKPVRGLGRPPKSRAKK